MSSENKLHIESKIQNSPPHQREFWQAIYVVLLAISRSPQLREEMILKGGMLLSLFYHGLSRAQQSF